ncbi:Sel1 domain-containing protein [Campylobacter blaseri]|uniref:beta-lactamase n=1 Tax=Campylobacter blaseri TaxID=2042961 RepID=A0A2P8R1I0_9BACT|nr:tetratricopeptide repeat protein [Campylobacter blaseri]PSM52352.1 hypothetical protein CQ405_04685 [Campylobacter blaseri]PSM54118.1 hypothetical protein CRN67_04685 [Campylobacter blaseri]QKF85562.1 Sel1 domain-containing protein [Campylobacter blaseri]
MKDKYGDSCNNLAALYKYGYGVKQDDKKAFELLKKACDNGSLIGCDNLGNLYYTKQDYIKAATSYKKACNSNNALSCFNLGDLYMEGKGVKQDLQKAKEYFNKACEYGYKDSCNFDEKSLESNATK